MVVYDEYDTFISQLMNEFMEDVSEQIKNGKRISVKRYNAAGNQITQNEQVEEMIEKGCNVICVNQCSFGRVTIQRGISTETSLTGNW